MVVLTEATRSYGAVPHSMQPWIDCGLFPIKLMLLQVYDFADYLNDLFVYLFVLTLKDNSL